MTSRRSILKATAHSLPALAVAVATPAIAASTTTNAHWNQADLAQVRSLELTTEFSGIQVEPWDTTETVTYTIQVLEINYTRSETVTVTGRVQVGWSVQVPSPGLYTVVYTLGDEVIVKQIEVRQF